MTEYTISLPISHDGALDLIANAINNPDSLYDMAYAAFRWFPEWREHGWELRAVAGVEEIIVTARRKT